MDALLGKKLGFLGCGNMSQALMTAMVSSGAVDAKNIWASNRSPRKLDQAVEKLGINKAESNDELLETCSVIILSVKPQDFYEALEPISSQFEESHIVMSLAAGITISKIQNILYQTSNLIRVMPNTPSRIGKGVVGYSLGPKATHLDGIVQNLFECAGHVVKVEEGEAFEAITVGSGSGIGFVYELMIYWKEWLEEHGLSEEDSRTVAVKTFLGAALLAEESESLSLEELQRKVTSKKGVTAAGLESLRELELERLLRYSFEKAVLRDRNLGQS